LHLFSGKEIAVGSTKFRKLDRFRKISPRMPDFVDPCNIMAPWHSSATGIGKTVQMKVGIEIETKRDAQA